MATAKDIVIKPISSQDGSRIIKRLHYSGKSAVNPSLNFGVFLNGRCGGALQLGPSMQKSNTIRLVSGTLWNEFLELNRMALADWLPRNGESRAISVCMRLIKKSYPHLKWVVSFADGTQCGDGTIYRASGFTLTGIKENSTIHEMPNGYRFADIGLRASSRLVRERVGYSLGELFSKFKKRTGCKRVPGFQLRYIYFLDKKCRGLLTVPEIPFSRIDEMGAGMYKGESKRPADGSNLATSQARQFNSDPDAPKS